jgi:hypothetical protein
MPSPRVELERQLQVEKLALRHSLDRLGTRASEAVDWRQHVRRRPVEALGAAMVFGAIVGAVVPRSSGRARSVRSAPAPMSMSSVHTTPSAARPEWNRLRDGLIGLLADRALVVAQDFLQRVTDHPPVSPDRTP